MAEQIKAKANQETSMKTPDKMLILFTVVNRNKADFYADMLQSFEVNMQLILSARGTANTERRALLGLEDDKRSVIISVIRREMADEALHVLEEKFNTVKGGRGIAYTVPLSSTIGVAIYQFLSNKTTGGFR